MSTENTNSSSIGEALQVVIDQRGVATVTLDRPEKHNAFDDVVIAELTATFRSLQANEQVKVMVLAGKGKSFSSGADLDWMRRMAGYSYEENLQDARALAEMLNALHSLPFPTIARVQGAAFGGGVGLVSCCDMAVGSPRASFSLSEVKIGLVPATIGPYVIEAIGQRASRRYFQTAERFSAEEAFKLGLLSDLVAESDLDNQLEKMISTLLANSPKAVRAAKQLVVDVAGRPLSRELIEDTSKLIASIRVSEEGQEGLAAFLDRREPSWLSKC